MAFDAISALSPASRHWSICARVARMWDYTGTRDDQPPIHVDLVLVDENGNNIYAEIPGGEAVRFKELIQEHQVYSFKKFLVVGSKDAYKPFAAKFMIKFTPWTTVTAVDDVPAGFPEHVYNLVPFSDLGACVGSQESFVDVLGQIVGVSKVAHVRVSIRASDTCKRVISLRDDRNVEIKLVLWGKRAEEFDADLVHGSGQESPVVGIFVDLLMKSYNNEETLSGGSACRWYLNEDIPEINSFFDRMGDELQKIQWISNGSENFAPARSKANLEHKTVAELRDMDPWETKATDFLCTVSIARLTPDQAWWFWSCSKCHRSATLYGSEYKCTGGCVNCKAYPKYRVCLVGTDGTGSAEFVFFNRVAQQLVGKTVMSLLKSSGLPREIAATVLQKYTLAVSVTQKSLTQRNVSFQVNCIETFFGRQTSLPKDTRAPPVLPASVSIHAPLALPPPETSMPDVELPVPSAESPQIVKEMPKRPRLTRTPIGSSKKQKKGLVDSEDKGKNHESGSEMSDVNNKASDGGISDVPPGYTPTPAVPSGSGGDVVLPEAPAKNGDHLKKRK